MVDVSRRDLGFGVPELDLECGEVAGSGLVVFFDSFLAEGLESVELM